MKVRIRISENIVYKYLCLSKANVTLTNLFPGDNCIVWLHKAIVKKWNLFIIKKVEL